MNTTKINQLADLIEQHPEHPFHMGSCHTCYIAWVNFMQGGTPPALRSDSQASSTEVADELGLSWKQKEELCFNWDASTSEQRDYAVKRLRHLAETGELVLLKDDL